MSEQPRISCLICAYNEAPRITAVLTAATATPLFDEIVVVDDGSTDGTSNIASAFPTVKVVRLPENVGKSRAMAKGVQAASGKFLILLDADLKGITPEHIERLAAPVLEGRAEVSMSLRKNSLALYRAIGLDFVSGERMVPADLLRDVLEHMHALPRFGIEVFMNSRIVERGYRIAVVDWQDVTQARKTEKMGFWRGVRAEMRMVLDVLRAVYPTAAVLQTYRMLRLRIPSASARHPKNIAADCSHE